MWFTESGLSLPTVSWKDKGEKVGEEHQNRRPITVSHTYMFQHLHMSLQDSATLQFCANKLDKKDFFGKSDPFMVFYRSNEDGTWVLGVILFYNLKKKVAASPGAASALLEEAPRDTHSTQMWSLYSRICGIKSHTYIAKCYVTKEKDAVSY